MSCIRGLFGNYMAFHRDDAIYHSAESSFNRLNMTVESDQLVCF